MIEYRDVSGNAQPVATAHPLPVTGTVTVDQPMHYGVSYAQTLPGVSITATYVIASAGGDANILPVGGCDAWQITNGGTGLIQVEVDDDGTGYNTGLHIIPPAWQTPVIPQKVYALRITALAAITANQVSAMFFVEKA